CQQGYDYPLTF
nr:immunoglobulin light chain junction region [Macaca mulatta]MOX47707.1 immunoglobulin light chain junction region [Macaca mulatta]MOX47893.1 immunoglobulin light chain junction region [Macaca mulatta]MOX48967.1 immunoglobulin light chain junction region [Macaca mulatta]MOX49134.1 immunoglobulin light chain junction region [Macaca mulatta]